MHPSFVGPHRHDAAIAAAKTAPHHPLDGNLAWTIVPTCHQRSSGEHALGPAGVEHQRRLTGSRGQAPVDRRHDPPRFPGGPIFGRQHDVDAQRGEELEVEEFGRGVDSQQADWYGNAPAL